MTELRGVTFFHSETGTEGGYWAFQDERYISKQPPSYGFFNNDTVFDSTNPDRKGRVVQAWHQDGRIVGDPIQLDPDYAKSSLFRGTRHGDREADQRLMHRWGFVITYPKNNDIGVTPLTDPYRPYGNTKDSTLVGFIEWDDSIKEYRRSDEVLVTRWSYEGLVILKDGDILRIYDPDDPTTIVWSGEIDLEPLGLFTDEAYGMWIHHDQRGVPRDKWASFFMRQHPARLLKAETIEQLAHEAEQGYDIEHLLKRGKKGQQEA